MHSRLVGSIAGRSNHKALHNYKEELYQLENSPLGKCPPFLIINATNLMVEAKANFLARDFSWGVCNIENELYTDLNLLHKLLLFHFEDTIIDLADCLSEDYVYKSQQKKEKAKSFLTGLILGTTALSVLGIGLIKSLK